MNRTEFMKVIQKIFTDNTSYNIPGHAANQADAIIALSVDLYTDANRFIYELLQNADDSSCKDYYGIKVWIKVFNDQLVVAHSGKAFDEKDIRGICNINNGTKKSDVKKTGYKGIGFKSVFGQSNNVVIYTDGEFFRFDSSYNFEWKWSITQKEWEIEYNRTFQYPWQIIPIYTKSTEVRGEIRKFISEIGANVATILKINHIKETKDAIENLSQNVNMFLFLKNITEINFEDKVIRIDRNNANRIILNKGEISQKDWLIKNIYLNVSKELKITLSEEQHIPSKLLEANNIEMTFAAQIDKNGIVNLDKEDRVLYSYLPTGETKYALPVLVNTSFLISANRESIHKDSKWNQWLFECISYEIFKWISELVISRISFESYKLIPEESSLGDDLAKSYNRGIKKAKEDIAFILSRQNTLIKISEALIDFTHLSEKNFVGEEPIKNFITKQDSNVTTKFYVKQCMFWSKLKKLGVSSFEWKDFKTFLNSAYFKETHSIQNNIELIIFLKECCESEKIKEVTEEYVSNIPFIWDHKNHINYPKQVCFPVDDDENWNNIENELFFVHKDILDWLLHDLDTKNWLESLGVKEKTDITYITQNIIPNASNYINKDNAIPEIQKLFALYRKGELEENLIKQLSEIKLITTKNTLVQASKCYLSDFYSPRLKIEKIFKEDMFISEKYCYNIHEKDEWRRFFKILGVKEGINPIPFKEKESKYDLLNYGVKADFFSTENMKFNPFINTFWADEFSNIVSLNLINNIENNNKLSFLFWQDFIENNTISEVIKKATAYWGNYGRAGRTSGDEISNYLPWFIKNIKCIPTLNGETYISSEVFLNTEEIKDIAGKYLPVFKGVDLSQDWRSFFNFKTKLELEDYLNILLKISSDIKEDGSIKNENHEKIQSIYSILLDKCVNWSENDIEKVEIWSKSNCLLNSNDIFTKCNNLYYFIDGNESIFQEQYAFIKLNQENRNHQNLKKMLNYFQVKLLSQNQFKLVCDDEEICDNLKIKLNSIVPYFKIWIEHDENDDNIKQKLLQLQDRINELEIYESKELKITYDEMNFEKYVNLHFDKNRLYVTNPWYSNSVLLRLAEVLCTYLGLEGYGSKLDFLLRADIKEIQKYFIQEDINIPEELFEMRKDFEDEVDKPKANYSTHIDNEINDKEIPPEFYHMSKHDYSKKEYIKKRIPRAVNNVIEHLKKLPEYDCSHIDGIAESVISGIIKNGNEITVIARPSDDGKILIFYQSEFDVLEYVDAELWYEDGITPPKQFTFGQLLKMTGVNRIPIKNIDVNDAELQTLLNKSKSEELEFNPIPYSHYKIAKIISSFANKNGGTLIFGLKEFLPNSNKIIGLSSDFQVDKITNKAISLLTPLPTVTYDWVKSGEKSIFVIKTEKAVNDVLLENQKYIRKGVNSVLENSPLVDKTTLSVSNYRKTIAIIIAIEDYIPREENQVPKVKYATDDALKFKEVLIKSLEVNEDDIYMYINEQAYKNNLEYDFQNLFHCLTEEDRLIFYYVGHGFHNGVTNYLSTYDMHRYHIIETSVSLRKILLDPLLKSKCKNALIFIDACAQSFQDENERSNINDINQDEIMILTSEFPYYATFLSCQPGQSSYGSDILKNGIWTYHLAKALSGSVSEVIQRNKYITDRLLKEYLSSSVCAYTKKELGYDQNPKAILDSSHETVIVEIEDENI
ncbi:sacsin N-terminal ATP-binding-like domain-containing protein [Clostridium chromiireducens]|uniref:Caspase domain protein n=1 Tax=Clostridium chromiireducens TaxID=225345 RepID=A0A1V4J0N6_9CLOT|nr:RNA-binding domain-containing protein [Clostridium chromiireducens]OPJ65881.1 caspase domain protein [Clostridium chromiireducens]